MYLQTEKNLMKPLTPLLTAAMLSALSLNACGQTEERKMSIQEQTGQRFQLNPNPREAYRIKIKINDAPGPLKLVHDMSVGYRAENCSYLITSEFIGATAHPEKTLKIPIRQIGHDEYESIVYLDAMKDEDYFGEGLCRWKAEGFGTLFKATGKPEETGFNAGDIIDNIMEQKTLTKYYWKGSYPYLRKADGSIYDDGDTAVRGADSPNDYGVDRRDNLFSITLTIEEL